MQPGTTEDLLADARAAGHPVTARLVTDWVQRGLLDSPQRRGAGRGRGSTKGVFSGHQRELFATLLTHRARERRVSALAVIPVALWLYWGEEYVPLRQVRRALVTWLAAYRQPARDRADRLARELLAQLDHPDASDTHRRRFTRVVSTAIYRRGLDEQPLHEALTAVFDPHNEGRRLGPPGATLDPHVVLTTALAYATAVDAVLRDTVTDQDFLQARQRHLDGLTAYLHQQPQLAAEAGTLAGMFTGPSFQVLVNSACRHLLTALGFLLRSAQQP